MARLGRSFYARDAVTVARELLGATLVHRHRGRLLRGRIVETEAYVGAHDLACHASKGRTRRTEVMFGRAGHAYVYLVYGIHELLNVVTGAKDDAQAVLIRAAEVLPEASGGPGRMNGPGKLARSLRVTRALNGADLCGSRLWIERGRAPRKIARARRIGVDYAGVWAERLLRFYDDESGEVSVRPARKRL